jgi:ribosomal protein S12 methylthiotransferase accessory factor
LKSIVAVFGKGRLAEVVYRRLSSQYKVVRRKDLKSGIPKGAALCLVLNDDDRPSDFLAAEKLLQNANKPWLGGFIMFDEGVVGPLVRPGTPGCSQCAEKRRSDAESERESSLKRQLSLLRHGVVERDPSISYSALLQMGCLICEEARKVVEGKPARTEQAIYVVNLKTFAGSLHAYLPDPLCPVCGSLPDDLPDTARISLEPSLKSHPETYRCKSLDELADNWIQDYQDDRTGLMSRKTMDPLSPFCDTLVSLSSAYGTEWTAGRSHSYEESGYTAILEGLERYCGMTPRGKQIKVFDSYTNLRDQALRPDSVGLYSDEQYELPDFPFERFDEEAPIPWVWGYSFLQQRPILVPQEMAYYGSAFGGRFVSEGSNGCALGGSVEEAIFYGILEVVERDAFLLTWYARLPVPCLDPGTAEDKELVLMIERLRAVSGYEVFLHNATMENKIPCIWATAKNRKKTGANIICAAGAHLDPIRAAKSAIFELAAHTGYLDHMYETRREEFSLMFDDPYRVAEMQDHALLYTVPRAEERLKFLLEPDGPRRSFVDEFKPNTRHSDLTEDLTSILQQFRTLELDVIVVDQTAPELLHHGFHCVKVIIPGMLPMTFGHHLKRLTGLDRVKRVPMELGYFPDLLTDENLNPHPHPFL